MTTAYVMCSYCHDRMGTRETDFSVKVDADGDVQGLECSTCGGSDVEPLPEAEFGGFEEDGE